MLTAIQQKALRASRSMTLQSVAFTHGKQIPREFTALGDDASPPLSWSGTPSHAQALALVMDDPDAPGATYTHWTLWNLPARIGSLESRAKVVSLGAREGRNDAGTTGYVGPEPPSGKHRYFFRVFALDRSLPLPSGASVDAVWTALAEHTLGWGELVGTVAKA